MDILAKLQGIMELNKSSKDKQKVINVAEVWHLWDHLVGRYDVIENTNVLENFAQDSDFKLILNHGRSVLKDQSQTLENKLQEYGIPMPDQPPAGANSTLNVEIITDEYIFRRIFTGIQTILPAHATAFLQSTSPKIREMFKEFMIAEMNLYDQFLEYGKLKGWTEVPPSYRV